MAVFAAVLLALYGVTNAISIGKVPEPSKYILSFPTGNNPLNITVDPSPEKNYFITLGDWGCSSSDTTGLKLQTGVANLMKSFVSSQKSKGMNLLFVGTVGDNFYESGQDCDYWKARWTDMYGEVATDYPWLTIFGNHDWGSHDPHALCAWEAPKYIDPHTKIPYGANQINADKGGCNPKNYYLPDFSYYYTIPELNFEWIALEESANDCPGGEALTDCSQSVGCQYLGKIKTASEDMMRQRANVSSNSNFFIVQHYAGSGPKYIAKFKQWRGNEASKDVIWTAGGHSHAQECVQWNNDGVCDAIMTGGGGHGCPNCLKGFYVIGFDKNKQMTQPISINDTQISCYQPCGQKISEQEILESEQYLCCHDEDEEEMCQNVDKQQCDSLQL